MQIPDGISPCHHQLTMGEVDNTHDTEYQYQANGCQSEKATLDQTVYQGL